MKRVLMVDDDDSMRKLVRIRLADSYEVVDTGDPAQALALALEHHPDAILLDVMMPRLSGFELCQSFQSLSYTSDIPIFVVSGGGEARAKYEEHCQRLGVKAYIDKPIDFAQLKSKLAFELQKDKPERRNEVRIRMRLGLRLKGKNDDGTILEQLATTEDVSAQGFLASCERNLVKGTEFQVYLLRDTARYAGRARVVRKESGSAPWQRYGFQFEETTADWVMQQNKC
jgi:DNA-binding response OmpR family regulator